MTEDRDNYSGHWYKDIFDRDYLKYWLSDEVKRRLDREAPREVAFVEGALQLEVGSKVLDLCCGQGRHAVELAKKDYDVVGVDLSAKLLEEARKRAQREGVSLLIERSDMREITYQDEFDAVINMFSAFGYFDSDQEDLKVIGKVAKALRPGGSFLIDLINRDRVIREFRHRDWHQAGENSWALLERCWDTQKGKVISKFTIAEPHEVTHYEIDLRLYTYTEITGMLQSCGLSPIKCCGDFENVPFDLESKRMIAVAKKVYC